MPTTTPTAAQKKHYTGRLGWLVDLTYNLDGELPLLVSTDGGRSFVHVQHAQVVEGGIVLS